MKKIIILIGIIFLISGCSSKDSMVCTLKNGNTTNVLNMTFEEGEIKKTNTQFTLNLGSSTAEDAENKLKEIENQYIEDGFTNVTSKLRNNRVIEINADADIEEFINLSNYRSIKKYYQKMGYVCK